MPSIRRALTVYLVLLVGGGLAVVAAVTDEVVGRTLEARRAAEADRIRGKFDEQVRAERAELDRSLLVEARDTFYRVQARSFEKVAERGRQFNALVVANEFASAPFPFVRQVTAWDASRSGEARGPVGWFMIQHVFAKGVPLADDAPPADPNGPLYQLSLGGRPDTVWKSPSLKGAAFPPVVGNPERMQQVEWTDPESLTLNGQEVRWINFKAPLGGPFVGRLGGRGGRTAPPPGPPPLGPPRPDRVGTQAPRLYVQYAKPLAGLDDETARHRQEIDSQLSILDYEVQRDRATLRLSLAGVAGCTFLGLLLGGPFLVRRGLRPVDRLTDAVGRVSERIYRLTNLTTVKEPG